MSWSVPTYTVGDVLTATNLNTYVRDNLKYLKGASGAFTLDAAPTVAVADTGTSRTALGTAELVVSNTDNTAGSHFSALRFKANDTAGGGTVYSAGRILSTFQAASFPDASLIFQTVTASDTFQDTMTIRGTKVGIGTVAPQGQLHVADSSGLGCLFCDQAAVGGTAITLVASGVTHLFVIGPVRCSAGATPNTSISGTGISPGGGVTFSANGGSDVLTVALSAGGAVTVQRTTGSNTFKTALLLLWI